jgi:hypothetical protein
MPTVEYPSELLLRSRIYNSRPQPPEVAWTLVVMGALVALSILQPLLVAIVSLVCVVLGLSWSGIVLWLHRRTSSRLERSLVAPGVLLLIGFAAGVITDVDYLIAAQQSPK